MENAVMTRVSGGGQPNLSEIPAKKRERSQPQREYG